MNSRARKRRTYASYRPFGRFWLTAEDRAWLNMVPIGREFGGKDFDRLATFDAFTSGRIDGQKAMSLLGLDHDALVAMVNRDSLRSQDLKQTILEEFQRRYIWGRDIARLLGRSPRAVSEFQLADGVRPVAGPGVDNCRQIVFKRDDVDKRLRRNGFEMPATINLGLGAFVQCATV